MALQYQPYKIQTVDRTSDLDGTFYSAEDFILSRFKMSHMYNYFCDILISIEAMRENGAGAYLWALDNHGNGDRLYTPKDYSRDYILGRLEAGEDRQMWLLQIDVVKQRGGSALWMRELPAEINSVNFHRLTEGIEFR